MNYDLVFEDVFMRAYDCVDTANAHCGNGLQGNCAALGAPGGNAPTNWPQTASGKYLPWEDSAGALYGGLIGSGDYAGNLWTQSGSCVGNLPTSATKVYQAMFMAFRPISESLRDGAIVLTQDETAAPNGTYVGTTVVAPGTTHPGANASGQKYLAVAASSGLQVLGASAGSGTGSLFGSASTFYVVVGAGTSNVEYVTCKTGSVAVGSDGVLYVTAANNLGNPHNVGEIVENYTQVGIVARGNSGGGPSTNGYVAGIDLLTVTSGSLLGFIGAQVMSSISGSSGGTVSGPVVKTSAAPAAWPAPSYGRVHVLTFSGDSPNQVFNYRLYTIANRGGTYAYPGNLATIGTPLINISWTNTDSSGSASRSYLGRHGFFNVGGTITDYKVYRAYNTFKAAPRTNPLPFSTVTYDVTPASGTTWTASSSPLSIAMQFSAPGSAAPLSKFASQILSQTFTANAGVVVVQHGGPGRLTWTDNQNGGDTFCSWIGAPGLVVYTVGASMQQRAQGPQNNGVYEISVHRMAVALRSLGSSVREVWTALTGESGSTSYQWLPAFQYVQGGSSGTPSSSISDHILTCKMIYRDNPDVVMICLPDEGSSTGAQWLGNMIGWSGSGAIPTNLTVSSGILPMILANTTSKIVFENFQPRAADIAPVLSPSTIGQNSEVYLLQILALYPQMLSLYQQVRAANPSLPSASGRFYFNAQRAAVMWAFWSYFLDYEPGLIHYWEDSIENYAVSLAQTIIEAIEGASGTVAFGLRS